TTWWPASARRSTARRPEVSVSGVRVSETVSTPMRTGMNSRVIAFLKSLDLGRDHEVELADRGRLVEGGQLDVDLAGLAGEGLRVLDRVGHDDGDVHVLERAVGERVEADREVVEAGEVAAEA